MRALIGAAVDRAEREVPGLAIDRKELATELDRAARDAENAASLLREVHAGELWLTRACARGDADALAWFERHYFGEIGRALGRIRAGISHDDFAQMVRERLFVAQPGRSPRIADYTGRGDLRTWLRVVLTRTLLNVAARRHDERYGDDEMLADLPSQGHDAELELMKRRYIHELRASFATATASLSVRERALLRHTLLDRLSIDAIGTIYGVHRATAARWVNAASALLRERVAQELASRLRIGRAELTSVLGMIESRLEISVQRCLADDALRS